MAEAFGADVVDEAAVTALVAEVEQRLGPVLAVVANATGPQPEAGLEELTWRTHLDQLEFFVKSPTLLVQAALARHARARRRPGDPDRLRPWPTAPCRACPPTSRRRAPRSV